LDTIVHYRVAKNKICFWWSRLIGMSGLDLLRRLVSALFQGNAVNKFWPKASTIVAWGIAPGRRATNNHDLAVGHIHPTALDVNARPWGDAPGYVEIGRWP
jgi:hypothetical protein